MKQQTIPVREWAELSKLYAAYRSKAEDLCHRYNIEPPVQFVPA